MFWLNKRLRRILSGVVQQERQRLTQYVGDETLLVHLDNGLFAYLDGRDASLTPAILLHRTWEAHIGRFIAGNLPVGGTFVDIGANMGVHSLTAAQVAGPDGFVVAFEPQQRHCDLLRRSVSANLFLHHFAVERMAIGAEQGTARLGKFDHLTGSATLTDNGAITAHEEAPMLPLADALAQVAAACHRPAIVPDMIKIDVEGFEYDVWNGMRDWAMAAERLTVILEYSPVSYRDMGRDPRALLADFAACGFATGQLDADGAVVPLDGEALDAMAAARSQFDIVLRK